MPTNPSTLDQLIARNAELRRRSEELEKHLREQEALRKELVARIWTNREAVDRMRAELDNTTAAT